MSKTAKWIIGILVLAGLGAGVGYAVKTGTSFKEITELFYKSPSQHSDIRPDLQPDLKSPSTQPSTPDTTTPGQTTPDQSALGNQIPFTGMPGLGIPPPTQPATGQQIPGSTQQNTDQQASGTLTDAGAALDQLKLQSPSDVLKACVDKLKKNDIVGAERYVSSNGLTYTLGTTTGVHEVLWKGLFQVQAYQTIGYDAIKVSGQTALIPLYASLGENRMIAAYAVMAHRGDGWKLDHITDPSKF